MLKNNITMKNLEVYEPKTQSGIGHVMSSSDTPNPSTTRITTLEMCLRESVHNIVPIKNKKGRAEKEHNLSFLKEQEDINGAAWTRQLPFYP